MKTAQQQRLYSDVEFLTELRPFRNYENLESLEKTCVYIKKELSKYGYQCTEQIWTAAGNQYKNIIAKYQPGLKRRLVVGAHYDVCGNQPGADDNGSAVAGLLETARLFSENQPQGDYCVEFVFYCLEEPPFFATPQMGSYIHAKSLYDDNVDVMGMICYEMIGYFSDEPNSQPFPDPALAKIYPNTANFIMVVGIQKCRDFNTIVYNLMRKNSRISVEKIDFGVDSLAGLSDQRNYWKFGFDACMINDTSFIRNPNYHSITDTIDTLDFEKMTAVIDSAYNAISKFPETHGKSMDLKKQFETHFNKVVTWAEKQEARILKEGVPLTEDQQIDAHLVGVKDIARVRLLKVDHVPMIDDPQLVKIGRMAGFLSSLTSGVSYRYGIYIRADQWDSRRLVVHELTHTMQYERFGSFEAFLKAYLEECLVLGYPNGGLEEEAIAMEKKICSDSV
ncbi:MAG: M28 family peptidase [Bacteroidota bacterium]